MENDRSSSGTVACLSTKGLPSVVTVSQLCWKGTLEAASRHCTPLPFQSISRCRKESLPRPAALTMSSCKTKSEAKQVRVLCKLCQKVPALIWPKRWPSEPYHKLDSLPLTMVSVFFKCRYGVAAPLQSSAGTFVLTSDGSGVSARLWGCWEMNILLWDTACLGLTVQTFVLTPRYFSLVHRNRPTFSQNRNSYMPWAPDY